MALFSIFRELARPAAPVAPLRATTDPAVPEIDPFPLTLLPDQFCLGNITYAEPAPRQRHSPANVAAIYPAH